MAIQPVMDNYESLTYFLFFWSHHLSVVPVNRFMPLILMPVNR